jgi:hypothetical protein
MARENENFPVPEVELSGSRVWSRQAVEKWAKKATGRTIGKDA